MDDIVKPNMCPECRNTFMQPFVCTTCGAQKLYDTTLRTAMLRAEKAEHEIERLRTELADAIKAIDRLHDERRGLMAECEAPRKDAERLRHLLTANPDEGPFIAVRKPNKWGIYHDEVLLADEAIYEIDRAMASSAEGGSNDR